MIRRFPFTQTYKSLAATLRDFKPPNRPTHAFMSNSELEEVLYHNWIVRTSSTLPKRIIGHLINSKNSTQTDSSSLKLSSSPSFKLHPHHYYYIPRDLHVDDLYAENSATEKVLTSFEHEDLAHMADILQSYKLEHQKVIEPELVNILMKLTLSEIPLPDLLPYENEVEPPLYREKYKTIDSLLHVNDSPFYRFIYDRIPHLYRICSLYEPLMFNDRDFQEYYIWLCYHTNDLEKLSLTLKAYLKQQDTYDSKVLSYAVIAHLTNYDVRSALNTYKEIMSHGMRLEPVFIESILQLALKYDSLFVNIREFIVIWMTSKNNGQENPLSPKALALALREYLRYSTKEDLDALTPGELDIMSSHYMVRSQLLRTRILSRYPTQPQKPVLKEDLAEINDIAKSLSFLELKDFYYQMMRFFAQKKNVNMVIFILYKMKQDKIDVDPKFVKLILHMYSRVDKYFTLLDFLQFTSQRISYQDQFLVDLYQGFVRTYPYHAPKFHVEFINWTKTTGNGTKLIGLLQVEKLPSNLSPYKCVVPFFKPLKYDTKKWSRLGPHGNTTQLNFRLKTGFNELFQRGVKPDFTIIEESYNALPRNRRFEILEIMNKAQVDSPHKKLAMMKLHREKYTKKYLEDFLRNEGNGLNAQNRLHISLVLLKNGLGYLAAKFLGSIRPEQLNDKLCMVKLYKTLRVHMAMYHMQSFIETIDAFPINDIVLNPYIYDKCCDLERKLLDRIKEQNFNDKNNIHFIALERLRGFIGDVRVRLDSDKIDVEQKIKQTFTFLTEWIEKDSNIDERKV